MAIKFLNTVQVDTDVLYVDASSDKVGIGTTSPSTVLEVSSSGVNGVDISQSASNASQSGRLFFTTNTASEGFALFNSNGTFQVNSGGIPNNTSGTNRISIIGSSGLVGIGTTSPNARLDVVASGIGAEITSGQSKALILRGGGNSQNIQEWTTTSSSVLAVVNSNGYFGIGTTSPTRKLHVLGPGNSTPSDAGGIFLQTSGGGGLDIYATSTAANPVFNFRTFSGEEISFSPNSTELMRLKGSNVGIGTTSPNEKLEVNGSVRVTGAGLDVGYGNNSNNFVQIGNGRTTNGFAFIDLIGDTTYSDYGFRISRNNGGANTNTDLIHRGTGFLNLNATQAGGITLKTSNAERVRINSSGNVGIRTTNPRTNLHVAGLTGDDDPALGSSTAPFFVSNTSTSYGLNIGVNNVGASWLQSQSNTSAIAYEMSLNPLGGNVGVGFINPSYKLDVNGTGRFTNTLYYSSLVQQSQADTKKDIANIDKNKATAIPFKQYKYKTGDTERVRYGVVVEDIEQYYPELVHIGEDGIKGVSYIDLLVKRVAELEKELEDISLTPGPKGDTGAAGAAGTNGSNGKNGADGNDHLKNVTSIVFNRKANALQVNISGTVYNFTPSK